MSLAGGGSRRSKASRKAAAAARIGTRRWVYYTRTPATATTDKIKSVRESLIAAKWNLDRKLCQSAKVALQEAEYHAATAPKRKQELLRMLRKPKKRLIAVCSPYRGARRTR
jgi:hypothetical protein